MDQDDSDLHVGRLALEKGMISASQLRECLREQSSQSNSGRKRPLGVLMVSKGYLHDEQLVELLDHQKKLIEESPAEIKKQDSLFGRLLIQQGVATAEQVETALQMQADMADDGVQPIPRLGQILEEMGVANFDTISNTLKLQYKTLYDCPGCLMRYNLIGADPAKFYRCRKCNGVLRATPQGTNAKADESAYGIRLEISDELPPEVAQAAADPSNEFDKYLLIREIGRGGMGTVYKAYQKDLKRTLALKILRGDDAEQIARFYNEAQTAAKLKHPNIVSLFEIGKFKGLTYLAMEYIDGETLDRCGKLPLNKAVSLMRDIAFAVQAAHEKGIIHRDLKPQNILIDREGRPYVTDFGLAREMEQDTSLTKSGIIVGTPAYMSPEQAQARRDLDAQTDVYSLGAVLYEAIAGTPPYTGQTHVDIVINVLNKDPYPPSRLNPAIPPDLEAVCLMALERDKLRRYRTARAFGEDLQRFLEGEPVLAKRPSLMTTVVKRVRKHKAAAWVAAAAILLLAAGGVVLLLQQQRARTREILLEARALENKGEHADARTKYEEVLRRNPKNADAAESLKRVESALADLAEKGRQADVIRKSGEERAGAIARSLEFLKRARSASSDEEALDCCGKAIEAAPDQEEPYVMRATLYQKQKKFHLAFEDLGTAIRYSKQPLPHHLARAELAQALGRDSDVLRELQRAVELNPMSAELRLKLGLAKLNTGDFKGAESDYTRVLDTQPENVGALAGRALARVRLDRVDEAMADATQAARADPNGVFPRCARAAAEARKALEVVRRTTPETLERDAPELVSLMLDSEGDLAMAVSSPYAGLVRNLIDGVIQAVDAYGQPEKLRRALSQACGETGYRALQDNDLEKAARLFDHSLKLDPTNPMAWTQRGFLRVNKLDFINARADADKALRLDPQCYEAMGVRGMARIGLAMSAIQALRAAEKGVPFVENGREAPWLADYVEAAVDIQRYFGHAVERPEFRRLKAMVPMLDRQLQGLKGDDGRTLATEHVSLKLVERARRLADLKDYDCAAEVLARAIALNGQNAAAYALRGEVRYSWEHYAEAAADFDRAIELDNSLRQSLQPKLEEARKKAGG